MTVGVRVSEDVLMRAISLNEGLGLPWKVVEERLGISKYTLIPAIKRYKQRLLRDDQKT